MSEKPGISIRYVQQYDIEADLNPWRMDRCACGRVFRGLAIPTKQAFQKHQRWCWVIWWFKLRYLCERIVGLR